MTHEKNGLIHLLLVDDHPIVRDGIKANLEDAPGIEIVGEAASGEQAMELARKLRPNIVVMDMKQTERTGV